MRSLSTALLLLPVLGLVTGCRTGDVAQIIPVSGGRTIMVQLTREGLKPGEGGGYTVITGILQPGTDTKDAYYAFGLGTKQQPDLKRIKIEDISDENAVTLFDVTDPKFVDGRWTVKGENIASDDPRMKWVYQITPSMRVYHFTLTRANGSVIEFNHLTMYPPFMKAMIRGRWGEKY